MTLKIIIPACLTILLSAGISFAQVIYVNQGATGNNDGCNWEDAFTSLHNAMNMAQYGDSIWLAQGIYAPDEGSGDRAAYYHLKNGVGLFGGFDGTETQFSNRDWELNETILSGDIGMPTYPFDNSFTLLYTEYCDTNTILDGLVLRDSRADGEDPIQYSGGGLYVKGTGSGNTASPLVKNCTFQNHYALDGGGGIYYNGDNNGAVSVLLFNCAFIGNKTGSGGAAILKTGGSMSAQNTIIEHCQFTGNQGFFGGAVAYLNDELSTHDFALRNCTFSYNSAFFHSGAILYVDEVSDSISVLIDQCVFQYNSTWKSGGAIGLGSMNNNYMIKNCHFEYNNAGFGQSDDTGITRGGAISLSFTEPIFEFPDSVMHILNCTFRNNFSDHGGAIALGSVHANTINCLFDKNIAGVGGGAIYTARGLYFTTHFKSINCSFTKNYAYESGGAFFCNDGSLFEENTFSIINSIVWDNPSLEGGNKLVLRDVHFKMEYSIVDFEHCDTSIIDLANSNLNSYVLTCGEGMHFNKNPLFKDTSDHVYEVELCSPAINNGNTQAIDTFGLLYDLNGNERIKSSIVDIGVFENNDFTTSILEVNPVSCYGGNDGSAYFEINGCPPYTYQWENQLVSGEGNEGLFAGNYFMTVNDSTGQSLSFEIPIFEPVPIEIEFTSINATGTDSLNGEISLTSIVGGTPPYSINWNTGDTSLSLENLLPGSYELSITDANDCIEIFSIPVDIGLHANFINSDEFQIFLHPNPAKAFVTIVIEKPVFTHKLKWILMNTGGQVLQREVLDQNFDRHIIDLKGLNTGLYYWKLETDQALIAFDKLIIVK